MPATTHRLTPGFVLLAVLAAGHLVLVLCGALHVRPFRAGSAPGQVHKAYGLWTGATSRYAFFAPGISPAYRISFDMEDPSGQVGHELLSFDNEALDIRAYSMALRFSGWNQKAEYQDNVARAWAATMFGRHPQSTAATLRVEKMDLPTMEAWRAGERPRWSEQYRAEFKLRTPPSSAAEASLP